jgi:predicted kinase
MQELVLIRGLPGSGKSTLANALHVLCGHAHFEADDYFTWPCGRYIFDPSCFSDAHAECRHNVDQALKFGFSVVVANTFSQHREIGHYVQAALRYGVRLRVFTATGNYANVHNVPEHVIANMRARWQE